MEVEKDIFFSVVIPTYNNETTIERSINSVLNQTRKDLIKEIIVVDDGSTDKTKEIINGLMNNSIIPISYYFQNNSGPASARNMGIKNAKANWIALLDADDVWLPEKIEKQYAVIYKNDDVLFLGSQWPLKILFIKKRGLVKLNARQLCIRSMPYTPSVVFRKDIGLELGLFNENMRYNEDSNYYQKFLLKDSYYLLAEKLVIIDLDKKYFAEKGMSSNLSEMYAGKKKNMQELYEYGLISKNFLVSMNILCDIKKKFKQITIKFKKIFK